MTDLAEQLEIRLAGARLNPERSTALPTSHYCDPAKHIRFESEKNCSDCVYSRTKPDGNNFCGRLQQYGKKCQLFKRVKK